MFTSLAFIKKNKTILSFYHWDYHTPVFLLLHFLLVWKNSLVWKRFSHNLLSFSVEKIVRVRASLGPGSVKTQKLLVNTALCWYREDVGGRLRDYSLFCGHWNLYQPTSQPAGQATSDTLKLGIFSIIRNSSEKVSLVPGRH